MTIIGQITSLMIRWFSWKPGLLRSNQSNWYLKPIPPRNRYRWLEDWKIALSARIQPMRIATSRLTDRLTQNGKHQTNNPFFSRWLVLWWTKARLHTLTRSFLVSFCFNDFEEVKWHGCLGLINEKRPSIHCSSILQHTSLCVNDRTPGTPWKWRN